jgi:hypothetical protein
VTEPRDEEIASLRQAIAGLMGRNVELEQHIETLQQERNELGIDEVALSLVRTARLAEASMAEATADEGGPDVRYVIPRVEVAMRGVVGRRGDGFGIRFPGPAEGVVAPALSTISMTVAHVPTERRGQELEPLRTGLEAAQAMLSGWDRDKGRTAAGEIAAETTHLLGLRGRWPDAETVAGLQALAAAFERFDKQAGGELEPAARERYVEASKALSVLARGLSVTGDASSEDLAAIGAALTDLAEAVGRRS